MDTQTISLVDLSTVCGGTDWREVRRAVAAGAMIGGSTGAAGGGALGTLGGGVGAIPGALAGAAIGGAAMATFMGVMEWSGQNLIAPTLGSPNKR